MASSDIAPSPRPAAETSARNPAVMLALWAVLFGAVLWTIFQESAWFFLVGVVVCVVVTLPMLRAGYEFVSSWTVVVAFVYVGFGIRGLAVASDLQGSRSINDLFLLGEPPSFFVFPGLLVAAGAVALVLGYSVPMRDGGSRRILTALQRRRFEPRFVPGVVIAASAIGLLAFVLFVQSTGGFSLAQLSVKRTTIESLDLVGYQSQGHLRAINQLSAVALWLFVAHVSSTLRYTPGRLVTLAFLLANASALPFYASSRGDVAYLFIIAGAIHLLVRQRRISGKAMVTGLVAVVLALSVMTALRVEGQTGSALGSSTANSVRVASVEALVLNRNFIDLPKSSHVINAVPEVLPYAYGGTIATWLVAPIPRALWPDKPLISAGPVVGDLIYDTRRAGVPPGLFAEMYWNFGTLGVLVGPFLVGLVLRRLDRRWGAAALGHPVVSFAFAAVMLRVGADSLSNGVGYAAVTALTTTALLLPVVAFSTTRARGPDGPNRVRPVRVTA